MIPVGKLIQIEARAGVALRENQVRSLCPCISDGESGVATDGLFDSQIPLLRVAIRLFGNASCSAISQRYIQSGLCSASG